MRGRMTALGPTRKDCPRYSSGQCVFESSKRPQARIERLEARIDELVLERDDLSLALLDTQERAGWTDSRRAMPPADEEVLMWQRDTFNIFCLKQDGGAWLNYESWFSLADIGQFFWQPLPNPPEQQ